MSAFDLSCETEESRTACTYPQGELAIHGGPCRNLRTTARYLDRPSTVPVPFVPLFVDCFLVQVFVQRAVYRRRLHGGH
jgi:hypothetical protein